MSVALVEVAREGLDAEICMWGFPIGGSRKVEGPGGDTMYCELFSHAWARNWVMRRGSGYYNRRSQVILWNTK